MSLFKNRKQSSFNIHNQNSAISTSQSTALMAYCRKFSKEQLHKHQIDTKRLTKTHLKVSMLINESKYILATANST